MQFENHKVVLFHGVADLRRGALGLLAFVGKVEPKVWYFFSNRSRSLLKCVCRDDSGIWLATKRLDKGCFQWIEKPVGTSVLNSQQVTVLCSGNKQKIFYENYNNL